MSLVSALLNGNVVLSTEEIDAEVAVVDEVTPPTPEVAEAIDEAKEGDELEAASSDKLDEMVEDVGDAEEAVTSLEALADFISMEAGVLTPAEFGMVMANANQILRKAGLRDESLSFEEVYEGEYEDVTDKNEGKESGISKEKTANGLREKAGRVSEAVVAAVKAIWAKLVEWWNFMFDRLEKIKRNADGLAKAFKLSGLREFSVEVPGKYSSVLSQQNLIKLMQTVPKVAHKIKILAADAVLAAKNNGPTDNITLFKWPEGMLGEPHFETGNGNVKLVYGSFMDDDNSPINVNFKASGLGGTLSAIVLAARELIEARKSWDSHSKALKEYISKGSENLAAQRNAMYYYNNTCKASIRYMSGLLSTMVSAMAMVYKKAKSAEGKNA